MSDKKIPCEMYTLIFRHDIVDEDGERHQIEEPLVVRQVNIIGGYGVGCSTTINYMMDRMKHELLARTCGG